MVSLKLHVIRAWGSVGKFWDSIFTMRAEPNGNSDSLLLPSICFLNVGNLSPNSRPKTVGATQMQPRVLYKIEFSN